MKIRVLRLIKIYLVFCAIKFFHFFIFLFLSIFFGFYFIGYRAFLTYVKFNRLYRIIIWTRMLRLFSALDYSINLCFLGAKTFFLKASSSFIANITKPIGNITLILFVRKMDKMDKENRNEWVDNSFGCQSDGLMYSLTFEHQKRYSEQREGAWASRQLINIRGTLLGIEIYWC